MGEELTDAGTKIKVQVNGEWRRLATGTTVAALLGQLQIGTGRCAVEVNREVIPRTLHATHALTAGDVVEVVSFVGGG